ncbi:MAG: hypothetical protein JSR17_09040 [Proteobacteria bacterium]|nr:hypothetical protein [Pseudomonadota bacterium]
MRTSLKMLALLALTGLWGCNNSPLADALRTKQDYSNYRNLGDRYGYHYFRGSEAPDRKYEPMYYNNTGYFTPIGPKEGRYIYQHAYENYNNGYYKGGFYGNEYYHNGHFNNGYYNPGNCKGRDCYGRGKYPRWKK